MELSAYEIALIGGAFTVLGALIGVLAAYWLTTHLEQFKERRMASRALRSAFAPALAIIYLGRHHGTHDRPQVGNILKTQLLAHASAVEEFRPFVRDSAVYQGAWEDYRKTVREDTFSIDTLEWGTDSELWSTLESKIHVLLRHADA